MYLVIPVYLISFVIFGHWYFDADKHYFYYGYEDALEYAESVTENFGTAQQFGRYRIEPTVEDMNPDTVYVVPEQSAVDYVKEGYQTTFDNGYYVVIESIDRDKNGEK